MNDFKSKLPDMKELGTMGSKLFSGIKNTVNDIISDYKVKRAEDEARAQAEEALKAKEATVESHSVEVPTPTDTAPQVTPIEEEIKKINLDSILNAGKLPAFSN